MRTGQAQATEAMRRKAEPATAPGIRSRFLIGLERLSETVTGFVSGHWGTLTACVLVSTSIAVSLLDRISPSGVVENLMTAVSLALLFLLQRSQTKPVLSLQVKLNELLRSLNQPDNHLINIERLSEEELQVLHDRYQKLHAPNAEDQEVDVRRELPER
jgi:low affinity Fe/Cu permease